MSRSAFTFTPYLVAMAILAGCASPGGFSGLWGGGEQTAGRSRAEAAGSLPVLHGTVRFPEARKAQATTAEIVRASALYLIDPDTNKALASTVSRADGTFDLAPPSTVVNGNQYILEGVKGVRGGLPGGDAVRLRTIVTLNGQGWDSVSTTSVVVDALTTAVSILSQLHPTEVPRANLKNKVQVSGALTGLNPNPNFGPTHPDLEILQLGLAVKAYAGADTDSVAAISAIKPTLTALSAASGAVGSLVRLTGNGFYSVPGSNTVFFGNATASVLVVEPKSLVVVVPDATGDVKVRTPQGDSGTLPFSVAKTAPVVISGVGPEAGYPGQRVNIYGYGFDTDKTKVEVYFGFTKATPVASSLNSVVVDIPAGITGAMLTVKSPLGTSNGVWFDVPFRINSAPTSGLSLQEATLGGLFPPTTGTVDFNGTPAEVISWTGNEIRVVIPLRATTGPINVKSGTLTLSSPTYTPKNGNLTAWSSVSGTTRGGGNYISSWTTKKYAYLKAEGESLRQCEYGPDGNIASVSNAGGMGLPGNHHMKGGIVLGNFAYFFNPNTGDYNGGTQNYYRAPVNSEGVIGSFSSPGTFPTRSYTAAVKVKNRLYLFNLIDGIALWTNYSSDGSIGGWTNNGSGGGFGNRIHGHPLVVGNHLVILGGDGDRNGSVWAPINSDGSIGSYSSYKSLPVSFRGASAAIVGKYLYGIASEANAWYRAPIQADDSLGSWEAMPGSIPNTQYHTDLTWVKGDYVYHHALNGLDQAKILD